MSTRLLDLEDRIITDTGAMVAKHELLVRLALNNEPFADLPFETHPDIQRYHIRHNTTKTAKVWIEDDIVQGPSPETYKWNTPDGYNTLSIPDLCEDAMHEHDLMDKPEYLDRLVAELLLVERRGMTDFLRCLVWVTDTLRVNDCIWGLGRGSSCASLVLFLLGVNKVDPVRYSIPMEEFYK